MNGQVNTIGVSTQITGVSYFIQFNTFCTMTYSLYNFVLGYSCPFVVSTVEPAHKFLHLSTFNELFELRFIFYYNIIFIEYCSGFLISFAMPRNEKNTF